MSKDARQLGDPGAPHFQVSKYPFYQLNRAVSRYNAIIGVKLDAIGVDIPSWRVLMILAERAPRSIGQIAEDAVINFSTMTRIIQRMTQAGMLLCAPRPDDNRVTEVYLSAHGEEKVAAARQITAPVYASLIRDFSEADFEMLLQLLERLNANLARPDFDSPPP